MEFVRLEPKTADSFLLPYKEMILLPLGDIQHGAQGCDIDRLRRHIAWGEKLRAEGKAVYYIGMGDYLDVASPSNQRALYRLRGDAYDSLKQMIDEGMERSLRKIQRILKPTVGHWLGLVTGHHVYEFGDGTTTDSRLAEFLGCKYLGNNAIVHLVFKTDDGKSKVICKIWLHHGEASGTTLEASIRKLRANVIPYWFANLYLIGHFHQKVAAPIPWTDTDVTKSGDVIWKGTTRYLVCTGSFLKGYQEGAKNASGLPAGDYAEQRMLPPNALGAPVIFIRPVRNHGATGIDINISI